MADQSNKPNSSSQSQSSKGPPPGETFVYDPSDRYLSGVMPAPSADFYFPGSHYGSDEGKRTGWVRRLILLYGHR